MDFVALQTLDGRTVHVNPALVVSIGETRSENKTLLTDKVQCVVTFVDGKFITVVESCDSVKRRMGR